MELTQIKEQVNQFLIEEMEMESSTVFDGALLIHDMGMTSLDFVDIKAYIGKNYGFMPTSQDMLQLQTLSDLYNYIHQNQR